MCRKKPTFRPGLRALSIAGRVASEDCVEIATACAGTADSNTNSVAMNASAGRQVEGFLDVSHFPYVHTGTFGRAQDTLVDRIEIEPLDDGYSGFRFEVLANNDGAGNAVRNATALRDLLYR